MTTSIRNPIFVILALALAIPCGLVSAQEGQKATSKNISVSYVAQGRSVDVALIDGKVMVRLDGKAVPRSKLRLEDGSLQVIEGNRLLALINMAPDSKLYVPKPKVRKKIGVNVKPLDAALASHLGLEVGDALVVLLGVAHDLAAAKAGLKVHDVITRVAGKAPVNLKLLQDEISKVGEGQPVTLRIVRGGKAHKMQVFPRPDMTITKKDGTFTITTLKSGKYTLNVTPKVTYRKDMTVKLRNDPVVLDLVYPWKKPAAPEGEASVGKAKVANQDLMKKISRLEARLQRIESLLRKLAKKR